MIEINSLQARVYSRLGQSGSIFGLTLLDIIKDRPEIMVLSSDMASTAGLGRFINTHPNHFLNVGIAEQNLVGIAAGLTNEGYKAIVTAQAAFLSLRSGEQIRQYLGYMKSNIIAVGLCAGFGLPFFGNTHYAIEDMAIMRSIPNITVLSPSDAGQAAKLFEAAVHLNVPVYIRLTGGSNTSIVYREDYSLEIGKSIIVKDGKDVTIFATGSMVYNSLQAAKLLEQKEISIRVVDIHTIKPLDTKIINDCIDSKLFVSVEEHNILGGLGGAIGEKLAEMGNCAPLFRLGVKDTYCRVGDYQYLLSQNRLLPEQLAEDIAAKTSLYLSKL
jgi:transketolase